MPAIWREVMTMRRNSVISALVSCLTLAAALSGPATAGIQLPAVSAVPAVPAAPYLWFDGASAAVLEALKARIQNPRTSPYFNLFKQYVDARIATLASADDDTRARFAKAAALLHVLGSAKRPTVRRSCGRSTSSPMCTARASPVRPR